jgi:lysophospholipid acyltransferase (LPLAT)-like uncharacterized protein
MRQLWRKSVKELSRQPWLQGVLANFVWLALNFVHRTNPLMPETFAIHDEIEANKPVIFAMWHGQHLMMPFASPKGLPVAAMLSRGADAEINARVIAKFGMETVRGSGGRDKAQRAGKGGAEALIQMKKALARGRSAVMIADISKGSARSAGEGVIQLARLSGRPIFPVAYVSSRAFTFRRSWDQTRLALPFGRAVVCAGEPLSIAEGAGAAEIEAARKELTSRLNQATARAYAKVGARP